MKKEAFVFDVDGTLTPARGTIEPEFHDWFLDFTKNNDCYLVSGSDRPKTIEQVGFEIYDQMLGVYQCNGNELWYKNRRVKTNPWKPSYELTHYLKNRLHHSPYQPKTNNHIEVRTGMINFSTVGRAATQEQRKKYFEWDKNYLERKNLCDDINRKFTDLHATAGGEISIDISPKKADKSQAAYDLKEEYERLIFFGDRTMHGGNDYSIALVIELGKMGEVHQVENYEETWEHLKVISKYKWEIGNEEKKC